MYSSSMDVPKSFLVLTVNYVAKGGGTVSLNENSVCTCERVAKLVAPTLFMCGANTQQ